METLALLKSGQLMGHKELKLSCGLTEFPLEILDLADSLEVLVLSNNRLSRLPESFGQLKKLKIVFFNNNQFEAFPAVLADCPALSMVSFKDNRIAAIDERALAPTIRWLILTGNRLEVLPAAIGKLSRLQKLMLAGNRLRSLPDELANCQNLELIRLSANRLTALPDWLFSLPRLSWLAYAGNPCGDRPAIPLAEKALPTIDPAELQLGDILGQGASGVIYKGLWSIPSAVASDLSATGQPQVVAVKLFKGEMTSDGLPLDEMRACLAAGSHPNLVTAIGKLSDRPDGSIDGSAEGAKGKAGLVFSFISSAYTNLGGPPDLDTCTRDTYAAGTAFTLPVILKIASGIAAAVAHLHCRGITHGDLYAHNILVNEAGESFLGDFGAASFYDPGDRSTGKVLERLEVRAFGCLLEDLLMRCAIAPEQSQEQSQAEVTTLNTLRRLQQDCLQLEPTKRPLFPTICAVLSAL
ncbi:leucine-rich repeat-containing protein kinase family protein [Leptolyngbya sp. BC1307]|uniref:leucine-rich repeat-containing protein kinase family protein n=1 Tax=Leptolyngbya sp. BC1307 TaxID=2029589 RepID=UPI000EFC37BB|nr:leucine-rich repeat-containing protein kinase family protein [Leptolyngbya sp. BC1307]